MTLYYADDFVLPPAATDVEILRAHRADYLGRVTTGTLSANEIRFPWSPQTFG